MTTHNERDSKAAEEYALRVAKNFSTVPDDKLSRHDIAKAAKYAHEAGISYGRAGTETGKELHFRKAQIEVLEEELTALKATLAVYKEALDKVLWTHVQQISNDRIVQQMNIDNLNFCKETARQALELAATTQKGAV